MCENVPSGVLLSDITTHSHIEPMRFQRLENKNRILRVYQSLLNSLWNNTNQYAETGSSTRSIYRVRNQDGDVHMDIIVYLS